MRLTSPEGFGMRGGEDPVGVSGDSGDVGDPHIGSPSDLGNTSLMA